MRKSIFTLLAFHFLLANAQQKDTPSTKPTPVYLTGNRIPISFDNKYGFSRGPQSIDLTKDITIRIIGVDALPNLNIRITCTQLILDKEYDLSTGKDLLIKGINTFFKAHPEATLHIEIEAGKKADGYAQKYTLDITSLGEIDGVLVKGLNGNPQYEYPNNIDPSFSKSFDISKIKIGKDLDPCLNYAVFYYPCCNRTVILGPDKQNKKYIVYDHLDYYSKFYENTGVVFIIPNYNVIKYTTSLTTSFINNFSSVPSVWTQLLGVVAGGAQTPTLMSKEDYFYIFELQKIAKLISETKTFLAMDCTDCPSPESIDCSDFEAQRKAFLDNVRKEFPPSGNIITEYAGLKRKYLESTGISSDSLNSYFAKNYLIVMTPDSLVSAAQNIMTTISTTSFYTIYNVPKLQNADQLVFTLNMQPNTGFTGTTYVPNQQITIQIARGWQLGWSAGFYYNSIKNNNYTLQPTPSDSLKIVQENNFSNGAFGIAAFLNAYYRNSTTTAWGAVLGLGASPDLNYSFLVGGSFGIGRINRFGLNAGLSISSIKSLSASQELGSNYATGTTISTYSKLKAGIFFSLTYAFGTGFTTQTASASTSSGGGGGGGSGGAGGASTPGSGTKGH
jgi:hypothetical protein